MTVERAIELILGQAGVLVLLIIILYGGFRGWYVYGWYARELRERNERLEARLDRASRVAESGTGLANRATRLVEDQRTEAANG